MVKKLKIILLIIIILYLYMPPILADDANEILEDNLHINEQILETSVVANSPPNINSRAAIVIDRKTNTILYGKDENSKRKMASTTKIMTCLLTIENCNLTDIVEISKKSAGTGGSRLGLKTGDKITINDLLYGLMLCSGNDAAVALAEHISGSVEEFSVLMNKKAKELGLTNTNFETPHGLDSPNHYTTAYELALLANHALNNEMFSKIVGTKSYTVTINGTPKNINNTNELLGNLKGVYGIKTGFTNGANRCLVSACKRDDFDVICVVLGADVKRNRTQDSINLIEYVFQKYEPINIQDIIDKKFQEWKSQNINNFNIIKGENNNIFIKTSPLKNPIIPIEKTSKDNIDCYISCNKLLNAPIFAESPIGKIEVWCNNSLKSHTDILTDCNINKKNTFNYFLNFFREYLSYIKD